MDINDRLYVEIVPLSGSHAPHPDPIGEGHFDTTLIYKVLGMYNPSETSECYLILANPKRELWFISNRHVRAFGLIDSSEMMLPKPERNGDAVSSRMNGQNGNGIANGHAKQPVLMGRIK